MKPFTLNPVVLHGSNHFSAKMFDAHKAPKPQTATLNWFTCLKNMQVNQVRLTNCIFLLLYLPCSLAYWF
jgi:hypothetical protein